jgi:hypothetical protein
MTLDSVYFCTLFMLIPTVAADHVDILGRSSLNDLILKVAGGKGDLVEERIESNILEYANKIEIYEEEETHSYW